MKHLLLLALLFVVSFTGNAQVSTLNIYNNTSCTVYFKLAGNVNGGACSFRYLSAVQSLPPAGTLLGINPGTITMTCGSCTPSTLGPSDNFNGATVTEADPVFCIAIGTRMGESCTGFPASVTYSLKDNSCNVCNGSVTAKWVNQGTYADLVFQ